MDCGSWAWISFFNVKIYLLCVILKNTLSNIQFLMSLTIWNFGAAGTMKAIFLKVRKKRLKRGLIMAVFAFAIGALVLVQAAE